MAMPAARVRVTLEQLHALPDDGNRYELIDGELFVSPAPTWVHQRVQLEIALLLTPYAAATGLEVLTAPIAVRVPPDTEMQPDVLLIPRLSQVTTPEGWLLLRRLSLVVEILSPSTARSDGQQKRLLYGSESVPVYWMFDMKRRQVECWHPGDVQGSIEQNTLTLDLSPDTPPLVTDLPTFFRSVLDD